MPVVAHRRRGLLIVRRVLGVLLIVVTVAHLVQLAQSPTVADDAAGFVGAAAAYAAIAVAVFFDQQWGYTAAVGLPLLGLLYSDHALTGVPGDPVALMYLSLCLAIVSAGSYLLWDTAKSIRSNEDCLTPLSDKGFSFPPPQQTRHDPDGESRPA